MNLTGALEVEQLAVTFQGKHLQLPLHVSFDTHIHFPTRHLELKHLSIASTPAFQVTLSGTVNNFLTQQDIQLSLHDTHFNLEHLRKLVNDFVPPEFGSIHRHAYSGSPSRSGHASRTDQFFGQS